MREYIIELELSKITNPDLREPVIKEYSDSTSSVVLGALIAYGDAVVSVAMVDEETDELGNQYVATVYERDGL
jgi:hypothetical protein